MKDYKIQQQTVSSPLAVKRGEWLEKNIKKILNYNEVDESNNSIINYGLANYNPRLIPDMFLDDILVEIKYSQEGNLYEHNISQMGAYYNYYKPRCVKLLLVNMEDMEDSRVNVRLFNMEAFIEQFLIKNKDTKPSKSRVIVSKCDIPIQTEVDIMISEEIATYLNYKITKDNTQPTIKTSKRLREALVQGYF